MNFKFLYLLICILGLHSLAAQQHHVIDRKGTQIAVTSSQVSTTSIAPSNPNEGDVWIDSASNTLKIWEEGTVPAWKEIASIRNWISSSQNGSYLVNHLVSYEGTLYKNMTGANSDTNPENDTVNWEEISVDIVPLWKSQMNGGSYATNDIINHNGILYKNLTGTNSDTTPNFDSTNWRNFTRWLPGKTSIGEALTIVGNFPSIEFNGTFYKNLTGNNTAVAPDTDTTNWFPNGGNISAFTLSNNQFISDNQTFDIDSSELLGSGVAWTTNGNFTLSPGTYELMAEVLIDFHDGDQGFIQFNFTDNTNTPFQASYEGIAVMNNSTKAFGSVPSRAYITITANTTVRLRCTGTAGTQTNTGRIRSDNGQSRVIIKKIN